MLKFSRLLIAVALLSLGFTQGARAADGDTAYIVTYFDTVFADKDKAKLLAKKLADASQKEDGNLRFEVLQRIGQQGVVFGEQEVHGRTVAAPAVMVNTILSFLI